MTGRYSLAVFVAMLALMWSLASHAQANTYRIAKDDVLYIQVFQESDLTLEAKVPDSGKINYPLLGEVAVAGKTVPQIQQAITDGLKGDYLVEPRVAVSIREYRPFFINGQVNKPGSYPYQPGLSVRKAVLLAGGLTERATTRKIEVIHEGENEVFRLGLDDPVRPGDIVTIHESFF